MELIAVDKHLIIEAISTLKGYSYRHFMACPVKALGPGGQRFAMNWGGIGVLSTKGYEN